MKKQNRVMWYQIKNDGGSYMAVEYNWNRGAMIEKSLKGGTWGDICMVGEEDSVCGWSGRVCSLENRKYRISLLCCGNRATVVRAWQASERDERWMRLEKWDGLTLGWSLYRPCLRL